MLTPPALHAFFCDVERLTAARVRTRTRSLVQRAAKALEGSWGVAVPVKSELAHAESAAIGVSSAWPPRLVSSAKVSVSVSPALRMASPLSASAATADASAGPASSPTEPITSRALLVGLEVAAGLRTPLELVPPTPVSAMRTGAPRCTGRRLTGGSAPTTSSSVWQSIQLPERERSTDT